MEKQTKADQEIINRLS